MVDWQRQLTYLGPAVSDIVCLRCRSLRVSERRSHEEALPAACYGYVVEAAQANLEGYPHELAWTHCRRLILFTIVAPTWSLTGAPWTRERGCAKSPWDYQEWPEMAGWLPAVVRFWTSRIRLWTAVSTTLLDHQVPSSLPPYHRTHGSQPGSQRFRTRLTPRGPGCTHRP